MKILLSLFLLALPLCAQKPECRAAVALLEHLPIPLGGIQPPELRFVVIPMESQAYQGRPESHKWARAYGEQWAVPDSIPVGAYRLNRTHFSAPSSPSSWHVSGPLGVVMVREDPVAGRLELRGDQLVRISRFTCQ